MTAAAAKSKRVDELRGAAEKALAQDRCFEAERVAVKAIGLAHAAGEHGRMIEVLTVLQAARMKRWEMALEPGTVTVVTEPVTDETPVERGCYLIQPPQVGADARRLRLLGLSREVPVAVICREPLTQLRLCPIVAISPGTTVRVKIDPPADPETPDLEWFVEAMEELGDWAIASIDLELEATKRVDLLVDRLAAIPEHARLHEALRETCQEILDASSA